MSGEQAVTIVEKDGLPVLDDRQSAWVAAYFTCSFNATEAAHVGLHLANYEAAKKAGWRLRHDPAVRAHIRAMLTDLGVSKERILANLVAVANADWADLTQIKTRDGAVIDARMDLTSLVKANELIGKELGMFTEKLELDLTPIQTRIVGVNLDEM